MTTTPRALAFVVHIPSPLSLLSRPRTALLLAFLFVALPRPSAAAPRPTTGPTAGHLQLSATVSLGTDDRDVGLGGRFGFTLPMGLYLGAQGEHFFGTSSTVGGPLGSVSTSVSFNHLAGEVGFDFVPHARLVLRPLVGFGAAQGTSQLCTRLGNATSCGESESSWRFAITTGAWAAVFLTGGWHVGLDGRLVVVDDNFYALGAFLGYAF
jgi:hypothetical protein